MMSSAPLTELAAHLDGSAPTTFVAGAACSRLVPTDLPDAATWKQLILRPLVHRADCGLDPSVSETLARVAGIQLEAIFAAIGRHRMGLGAALISLIEPTAMAREGEPNGLHRLLVERVSRAPGSAILTTNFDQCFERAASGTFGGRRWLPGEVAHPAAHIFKLHGSTEDPATLRHTFESVGRAFDASVHAALRLICAQKLVVLGYFGADPDVLELLGAGDTVWWLARDCEEDSPRHGARRLGRLRDVRVVTGDFDALFSALGRVPIPLGNGRRLASRTTDTVVSGLDVASARASLAELTFRALTADASMQAIDSQVFRATAASSARLTPDAVWRGRGVRSRYRGGLLLPPLRSIWCFLRAAFVSAGSTRLGYLSDALDSVEMLGLGLVAPIRAATLPFHAAIRWRLRRAGIRTGPKFSMAAFRVGRSALFCRLPRLACSSLSATLAERDGDMFLGGIALRWRAMVRSIKRDAGWRQDVAAARELFAFEDREQELADLLRTEGFCVFAESGDIARARELFIESRRSHDRRGESRGAKRCAVAMWLLGLGLPGRLVLRILMP